MWRDCAAARDAVIRSQGWWIDSWGDWSSWGTQCEWWSSQPWAGGAWVSWTHGPGGTLFGPAPVSDSDQQSVYPECHHSSTTCSMWQVTASRCGHRSWGFGIERSILPWPTRRSATTFERSKPSTCCSRQEQSTQGLGHCVCWHYDCWSA